MLKQRREAAEKIARSLRDAEAATDRAMVAAAGLNHTMLMARSEANLSVLIGQEAIDSAAAAYASFAQGMRHMVDAHHRLRDAQKQVGLQKLGPRELGVGDVFECPDDPFLLAEAGDHLRAVA